PERQSDWNRAVPGVAADATLRAVRPAFVPRIDQFIDESRDGIGEDRPEDLPRLPGESMIARAAGRAAIGMMSALSGFLRFLGGAAGAAAGAGGRAAGAAQGAGGASAGAAGAGGQNWLQRMAGWSAGRLEAMRRALEGARLGELGRLMRMLETDPDR